MPVAEADVIIVGAGPVGLWLAGELRLAGVPVTVLERTSERGRYTRGMGVHARTIEVLAMRGMASAPLDVGRKMPQWHFGMLPTLVDFSVLPTAYPFVLAYPQPLLEDLLENRAVSLGATVLRGHAVTGVSQDASSVTVGADTPDGPRTLVARYAVGCDGAGSTVRKAAGIEFPGTDSTLFGYVADVSLSKPPERGAVSVASPRGALIIAPIPGGRFRFGGFDPEDQNPDVPLTEERLREIVIRAAGTDYGLHDAAWLSRFGNATRQAASYRAGRILVAGDAAHMHLPTGGVGLNIGVQDAMNLGWKLAAVAQGRAPDALLDSYGAERHPVGQALLTSSLGQTALIATFTPEGLALRDVLSDLLRRSPDLSENLAMDLSGLSVSYPTAGPAGEPDLAAHPLTGRRVPDLAAGPTSLFGLLAAGRPVLLDLTGSAVPEAAAEAAAVLGIATHTAAPWPGQQKAAAVLVRPDGYAAWAAGAPTEDEIIAAAQSFGVRFAV